MQFLYKVLQLDSVAPLVGAWIEIPSIATAVIVLVRRSSRRSVD